MRTSLRVSRFMYFTTKISLLVLFRTNPCVRNIFFSEKEFFLLGHLWVVIFVLALFRATFGIRQKFLFLLKNICILCANPYNGTVGI